MATYTDFTNLYGKYSAYLEGSDSPGKQESKRLAASLIDRDDARAREHMLRRASPQVVSDFLIRYAADREHEIRDLFANRGLEGIFNDPDADDSEKQKISKDIDLALKLIGPADVYHGPNEALFNEVADIYRTYLSMRNTVLAQKNPNTRERATATMKSFIKGHYEHRYADDEDKKTAVLRLIEIDENFSKEYFTEITQAKKQLLNERLGNNKTQFFLATLNEGGITDAENFLNFYKTLAEFKSEKEDEDRKAYKRMIVDDSI